MTEIVCGPWDNYFPPGPGPFLVGPRESQLYARPELPLTHGHTLVAAHLGGVVFQHVTSCSDDIFAYVAGKGFLRGKNTREIHICRTKLTSHTGENHCGLFSHST